jgi:hypothetical protein
MISAYVFLALDLANERAHEARRHRLAAQAINDRPSRAADARRLVARVLALISRGSAAIVRRLDRGVADDLGRALAPTE